MEFDRTHGRTQQFCSPRCALIARYERQRAQGVPPRRVVVPCAHCGRDHERFLSDIKSRSRRFCSKECAAAGRHTTAIEAETYAALDSMGIAHQRQVQLGPTRVDVLIPETKTVVEVQGDFWHCNPAVYPDGPRWDSQRICVQRDVRRFRYLRNRGYRVIELWESDIKARGAMTLLAEML